MFLSQVLLLSLVCPLKPTAPTVWPFTGHHQMGTLRVMSSSCTEATTRCRKDAEAKPAPSSARSRVWLLGRRTGWLWWPTVVNTATSHLSRPGQVSAGGNHAPHFGTCQSIKLCLLSSVPATVASLRVRSGNESDTLWVNWDRGAGDLSGYLLTLYNPNGTQQACSQLSKEATEFVFLGLVPGRLYRAEVLSQSGELSNGASTVGRTGKRII